MAKIPPRFRDLPDPAVSGIFAGEPDTQNAANAENPLVVYRCTVIIRQIVLDTPIVLIWVLNMDLLHQPGQPPIFTFSRRGFRSTIDVPRSRSEIFYDNYPPLLSSAQGF
jgi:hypothetical protein